jgi:hypothetical protein
VLPQAIVRATPNLADALTSAGTVPLDNELLRLVHDNLVADELGQLADRIDEVVQVCMRAAKGAARWWTASVRVAKGGND